MNILITGTSRGLGEALAMHALNDGHAVFGMSRGPSDTLNEFTNFHSSLCDLSRLDSIDDALRGLLEGHPPPELVFLNAGQIGRIGDMQDTSQQDLDDLMAINLWCNKHILDYLLQNAISPQQVIAISSGAAVNGHRGWNGYSISKAALNMLVKLYTEEMPKTHFTSLAPGLIDTAMQDYLCETPEDPRFSSVDKLKCARGTPLMPGPKDAADLIMGLLERLTQFPTGSFVDVRNL